MTRLRAIRTLPPERLQSGVESPQHLITLSSVEDDGLGEELNVIWEIEPGAKVIEKVALPEPTGFDSPEQLDAFLDAVRWGAASTAAYLLAAPGVPDEARQVVVEKAEAGEEITFATAREIMAVAKKKRRPRRQMGCPPTSWACD